MIRAAIIAAMEREILPLVHDWTRSQVSGKDQNFLAYEKGELVVVASGIGCQWSEKAARAAVQKYRPETLVSAGLAGALIRSLKVGSVMLPSVIVDAQTGAEYRCDTVCDLVTGGVLVSATEIAGTDSKTRLVERFHGLIVDMEAAGVARVARECRLRLQCVKAISDELEFPVPPLNRFIDGQGKMQAGRFASWVALRPQYWMPTIELARNSRRASLALAAWLRKNLTGAVPGQQVVTLDGADHIKAN